MIKRIKNTIRLWTQLMKRNRSSAEYPTGLFSDLFWLSLCGGGRASTAPWDRIRYGKIVHNVDVGFGLNIDIPVNVVVVGEIESDVYIEPTSDAALQQITRDSQIVSEKSLNI